MNFENINNGFITNYCEISTLLMNFGNINNGFITNYCEISTLWYRE